MIVAVENTSSSGVEDTLACTSATAAPVAAAAIAGGVDVWALAAAVVALEAFPHHHSQSDAHLLASPLFHHE